MPIKQVTWTNKRTQQLGLWKRTASKNARFAILRKYMAVNWSSLHGYIAMAAE